MPACSRAQSRQSYAGWEKEFINLASGTSTLVTPEASQSPVAGTATTRIFDTEKSPARTTTAIDPVPAAFESEKSKNFYRPHVSQHAYQSAFQTCNHKNYSTFYISKENVANEGNGIIPVCFFARKNYERSLAVRRDGAVPAPVETVLVAGARPNLIQNKRIDPT